MSMQFCNDEFPSVAEIRSFGVGFATEECRWEEVQGQIQSNDGSGSIRFVPRPIMALGFHLNSKFLPFQYSGPTTALEFRRQILVYIMFFVTHDGALRIVFYFSSTHLVIFFRFFCVTLSSPAHHKLNPSPLCPLQRNPGNGLPDVDPLLLSRPRGLYRINGIVFTSSYKIC